MRKKIGRRSREIQNERETDGKGKSQETGGIGTGEEEVKEERGRNKWWNKNEGYIERNEKKWEWGRKYK